MSEMLLQYQQLRDPGLGHHAALRRIAQRTGLNVATLGDTGRVQSGEARVEPRYHRVISEFEKVTCVPIVLNTSFNENEPIVMTPRDALETFKKTKMDVLALGNYLVRRNGR